MPVFTEKVMELHPYVKTAWLLSFAVVFFTEDLRLLALVTVVALLFFLAARSHTSTYGKGLYALIPLGVLITVLYLLEQSTERHAVEAIAVMLGWVALSLSAITFFVTTPPHEVLFILRTLRVPRGVAVSIHAGFRFVPVVLEEVQRTFMAQRARGLPPLTIRNVRYLPLIIRSLTVPLFVSVAERSESMYYALSIRGEDLADRIRCRVGLLDVVVLTYVILLLLMILIERIR